jgi:hypothetical protein
MAGTVATTSGPPSTRSAPRTQYIYLNNAQYSSSNSGSTGKMGGGSGGGGGGGMPGRAQRVAGVLGRGAQQASVPKGVPRMLGNQHTIVYAWIAAMGVIAVDEWHTNKILPRPSRLWWTSLMFGGLAMAGMVDALIPLANAFAIGMLLVLMYQFYAKKGQFS